MDVKRIFRFKTKFRQTEQIILRDYLAMERTKLANERTLLSYIRSSLYLLVGGIAVLQIQGFEKIKFIGYLALMLTVVFVIVGVYRFVKLNNLLKVYYYHMDKSESGKEMPGNFVTEQHT
jgi:putative membrane protein